MIVRPKLWSLTALCGAALFAFATPFATPLAQAQERPLNAGEKYAYNGAEFTRFVRDSYAWSAGKDDDYTEFYKRFDANVRAAAGDVKVPALAANGIDIFLSNEGKRIAALPTRTAKADAQTELSATLFRVVKKAIPRFSLDRGFEFPASVHIGERQCLLQSVLAAGMLQKAGVPTGIAMVWKSDRGDVSNLGHCVAVVRLADGSDRILDLSSDAKTQWIPDLPHQGLFLTDATGLKFVEPQFDKTNRIIAYKLTGTGKSVKPSEIRPLSAAFVRSQFYYYRGERAPGHAIWDPVEQASLPRSVEALTRSLKECPENPLSTYMLGKALAWQGKKDEAQLRFVDAHRLYRAQGHVPDSAEEVFALERVAKK